MKIILDPGIFRKKNFRCNSCKIFKEVSGIKARETPEGIETITDRAIHQRAPSEIRGIRTGHFGETYEGNPQQIPE